MKKLLALVLSAVMLVGLLCGCGGGGEGGSAATNPPATQAPATEAPEQNNTPEDPSTPDTPEEPGNTEATGSVYYLNFKPEADKALQDLAGVYTSKTGVPVKVVTAASGTYSDTLTAEMGKSEPPTIFNIGNAAGMADWGDYALDLTGAKFFDERINDDYVLYDGSTPKALGYCFESFGIIVHTKLLADAGHSLDEIKDFASLKAVADDIHSRAADLGFDAFSSPGLDGSSSWRFSGHLANIPLYYEYRDNGLNVGSQPATVTGAYLDNFRNIWDLYITDTAASATSLTSATGDMSEAEFGQGQAVFYQNGDWEYANLTGNFGMDPADLAMIPIYSGVAGEDKAGLCSGTENCWAVNAKASQENIQASLDFLYWMVTSEEGTTMLRDNFSGVPFKGAKETINVFAGDARTYAEAGNYTMFWAFNDTPNVDSWRATVVTALAAYSAAPSDDTWAEVVTAFVDGWAYEYNVING